MLPRLGIEVAGWRSAAPSTRLSVRLSVMRCARVSWHSGCWQIGFSEQPDNLSLV
jgi:hypothetical protein